MKITKRKLNKIVKEEIMNTMQGFMSEEELSEMGQVPFDGAGFVGESPIAADEADRGMGTEAYAVLEAELRSVLADQSLDPALRMQKIKEISAQLRELGILTCV